jgi:hypothetical protein
MIPLDDVVQAMKAKGYKVDTRPDALNLVGIRTDNPVNQDRFDDYIAYFAYQPGGKLYGRVAEATTDPSTYYLENPMTGAGAAILKGGQYVDAYAIGKHRNIYNALVQVRPVTVIRDKDRDGFTNLLESTETGIYGINIHRPTPRKEDTSLVGKDSAGCQVFRYVNDFTEMMRMADTAAAKYGNRFTYTLIDERDTVRNINTGLAVTILGAATLGAAYFAYKLLR